jgi:hypothetical protein
MVPVEAKGAVHSYTEVHHAIQPAFKAHTYLVLLVDLDTQKGKPTEHEALRVVGNLATPDGKLARPELNRRHRHARAHGVRRLAPGLALPQWTIDETVAQPAKPLALSAGVNGPTRHPRSRRLGGGYRGPATLSDLAADHG